MEYAELTFVTLYRACSMSVLNCWLLILILYLKTRNGRAWIKCKWQWRKRKLLKSAARDLLSQLHAVCLPKAIEFRRSVWRKQTETYVGVNYFDTLLCGPEQKDQYNELVNVFTDLNQKPSCTRQCSRYICVAILCINVAVSQRH